LFTTGKHAHFTQKFQWGGLANHDGNGYESVAKQQATKDISTKRFVESGVILLSGLIRQFRQNFLHFAPNLLIDFHRKYSIISLNEFAPSKAEGTIK